MMLGYKSCYSQNNHNGFTLLEALAVIAIVGILAGISSPGVIAFINRSRVNQALSKLLGFVQTTQQEAIKQSKTCTVNLPASDTNNASVSSTCLVTGEIVLEGVTITYNLSGTQVINFNYRGDTSPLRTIVLYSDNTPHKRCMVISNGIGIIRTGVYTADDVTSVSAANCDTKI